MQNDMIDGHVDDDDGGGGDDDDDDTFDNNNDYNLFTSWKCVGKLSGGHQAPVMVLAVDDTDTADGNICVVTGSKDHYIKASELCLKKTDI